MHFKFSFNLTDNICFIIRIAVEVYILCYLCFHVFSIKGKFHILRLQTLNSFFTTYNVMHRFIKFIRFTINSINYWTYSTFIITGFVLKSYIIHTRHNISFLTDLNVSNVHIDYSPLKLPLSNSKLPI